MGRMTNGEITYSETRKIAEYENKTAKVSLSFAFDDGEDYDTIISGIQEQAKHRVLVMLGLAKPEKAVEAKKVEEPADEPAEEAPKPKRGRPKVAKAPVEVAEDEPADEPAEEVEEVVEDDLSDLDGETEAVEITDVDLTTAIAKRKAKMTEAGDEDCGVKLRKLIGKYAPKIPAIPQDKRADFLEKLKALK